MNWPVILKYTGDYELVFIASQAEWEADPDLHFFYEPDDCLIDSSGAVFHLNKRSNNFVMPKANGKTVTLEELTTLIQLHASQLGSCCVAKIGFDSVSEAIAAVRSMSD